MFGTAEATNKFHEGYCVPENPDGTVIHCDANDAMEKAVKGKPAQKSFEKLRDSEVRSVTFLRSGGSQTDNVELSEGGKVFRGIFKLCPGGPRCIGGEFAAGYLAQTMGMEVVAVGVFRTIEIDGQMQTGYLYEFIPGDDLAHNKDAVERATTGENKVRYESIQLLDLLIDNLDRQPIHQSGCNYLFGRDGKLYAIDHGIAFTHEVRPERMARFGALEISTTSWTMLNKLCTDKRFQKEFLDVIHLVLGGGMLASALLNRARYIVANTSKVEGRMLYQPPSP